MERREAIADNLRALADDLKGLVEAATTDPKERQRKERRWGALYGAIGILTTFAARRVAVKVWGVLTGEEAPMRRAPRSSSSGGSTVPPRSDTDQTETMSSSSSSVK